MELPYSEELNIGHLSKLFGKQQIVINFFGSRQSLES